MRAFCFDIDMVFFVLNAISTITCWNWSNTFQKFCDLLKGYLVFIRPLVGDVYAKLSRNSSPDFCH
jgi:hypothetical protein